MDETTSKLYQFVRPYLVMEIKGVVINCPYWMNKRRRGEIIRGFGNGKAEANAIKEKLVEVFDGPDLYKLAKRERIGIDCSGFVYRALNCLTGRLDDVFRRGINRTSASMLTSKRNAVLIDKIEDIKAGDMIRMREGKHVAVVIEIDKQKIIYAHSSSSRYTVISGVHLGEIKIVNPALLLDRQIWLEKLRKGGDFQSIYFRHEKGDAVYRLKWMNS